MRYYGIKHRRFKENSYYSFQKTLRFLQLYLPASKKKRQWKKDYYESNFTDEGFSSFRRNYNSSISDGKYLRPFCLITSDLFSKENLPKLKKGIKKLILNCTSKDYLSSGDSIEEIFHKIDNMDSMLYSHFSGLHIYRLVFDSCKELKDKIDYFDLYLHDFNSSYLAIEFHLALSDSYKKYLESFIASDYHCNHGIMRKYFSGSRKKNGGRERESVAFYNDGLLKSDVLYESLCCLKWAFYNELFKYFPTLIHSLNKMPPAIFLFETNISYSDNYNYAFWESTGLERRNGQSIDENLRFYFSIELSGRYSSPYIDTAFLVNAENYHLYPGFYSVQNQLDWELSQEATPYIFRFLLLRALIRATERNVLFYAKKLNHIKLKKGKLGKLLKLRYNFECSIDYYERYISNPHPFDAAKVRIEKLFDCRTQLYSQDYRNLTIGSLNAQKNLKSYTDSLRQEFDSKTAIIEHLTDYKNESRNQQFTIIGIVLSLIATVIAAITLYFTPIPSDTISFSSYIFSLFSKLFY